MPTPLLIADVPWLLYRAFFSLPKTITDEDGKPVDALLGTVNALLAAIEARPPRAVVACFGAEEAKYRVELYPAYHAHREPMPPALAEQWSRAPELLASFGWTVSTSAELEADDAMYSYACKEDEARARALLVTGDRDLYQVVGERVAILELPRKGHAASEIDAAGVRERYGIDPQQVCDFIALRGDPSDGLPGAPGIGAKTAAELLRRHGSLEGILSAVEPVTTPERPRIAAALREHAELLRTFRRIAALVRTDVERPADHATDFAAGARKAEEMGMKRLAGRLGDLARG